MKAWKNWSPNAQVGQQVRENLSWLDTRLLWLIPTGPGWVPLHKVNWARLANPCRRWKGVFWYLPWPCPSSLASPSGFPEGSCWGLVRSGLWGPVVPFGQHNGDGATSNAQLSRVSQTLLWRTFSFAEASFWNRPVQCHEGWGSFGY